MAGVRIVGGQALMKRVPLRLAAKVAVLVLPAIAGFGLYPAVAP